MGWNTVGGFLLKFEKTGADSFILYLTDIEHLWKLELDHFGLSLKLSEIQETFEMEKEQFLELVSDSFEQAKDLNIKGVDKNEMEIAICKKIGIAKFK